jgi:hypothetical protein
MRVANMEQNGGTGYITDTANVDQVVVETASRRRARPAVS